MSKVIVIGAGMVGSAMAIDMAKNHDVTLTDINLQVLEGLKAKHSELQIQTLDVTNKNALQQTIKAFDLVICAVPGFLGFETLKSIIEGKKNVVDISFFPEKAEMLLENTVIALLKTHEINFINEWLQPFKDNFKSLPIFKKTDTIQQLSNDLDQMQTLGELYYEFSQFEKAIECFSWEMELKPTDPKPIQWIAKLYRERGMIYEADTYRQLCIDIQKQA